LLLSSPASETCSADLSPMIGSIGGSIDHPDRNHTTSPSIAANALCQPLPLVVQ
jgi:hypothetical protein